MSFDTSKPISKVTYKGEEIPIENDICTVTITMTFPRGTSSNNKAGFGGVEKNDDATSFFRESQYGSEAFTSTYTKKVPVNSEIVFDCASRSTWKTFNVSGDCLLTKDTEQTKVVRITSTNPLTITAAAS